MGQWDDQRPSVSPSVRLSVHPKGGSHITFLWIRWFWCGMPQWSLRMYDFCVVTIRCRFMLLCVCGVCLWVSTITIPHIQASHSKKIKTLLYTHKKLEICKRFIRFMPLTGFCLLFLEVILGALNGALCNKYKNRKNQHLKKNRIPSASNLPEIN